MAVVIRMKQMGRKHRPYYRICATDSRAPRDGKIIEEVGTYDPMIQDTDARVTLVNERVAYWLGVGAKPSEKVAALLKKYGPKGTRIAEQTAARDKLKLPKAVPPAGEAVFVYKKPEPKSAEAPVEAAAEGGEVAAEAPAEAAAES